MSPSGVALRSIWDWAVRAGILSLTPGQSPIKSNLKKWGLTATAQCDCGQGDETFLHQQLHCHLTHRRNMKQTFLELCAGPLSLSLSRGAASDEAGGSSAVKGNTVAAVEQAVCTGVRNLGRMVS